MLPSGLNSLVAFAPAIALSVACSSDDNSSQDDDSSGAGGYYNGTGGSSPGGTGGGGSSSGGSGAGGTASSGGSGTGGSGTGGSDATDTGGASNAGGTSTGGGQGMSTGGGQGMSSGSCTLGAGTHAGEGSTTEQYLGADVTRDGKNYRMITNGWGANWESHDISWLGTTMMIHDYQGDRQANGAPAGYPTIFCGDYSDTSLECGLPLALSSVQELNTAASWSHPDGNGIYNVAYDVWLGDAGATSFGLESYFMVWLHDPIGEGPAGSPIAGASQIQVADVPGNWNIIAGMVNGRPIVNYVRAEGDHVNAIAFDIMDFIRDAQDRQLSFPGNDVLAIAIGFEIWQGPVTRLGLDDFCLDIQ